MLGLKADQMRQFTDIVVAISRVYPMDLPNVFMTSIASARKQHPALGLSITRKLLNLLGWAIAFQSEQRNGSKFYFELVFDLSESQSETPSKVKSPEDYTHHLNLLMAEDNDVNALVLGKIIKKWGFDFHRVVNGDEAV